MKTYLLITWAVLFVALPAGAQRMVLEAPAGFDQQTDGIPHGKLDSISR